MITKEQLAESYALNARLVKMHADGLSHEDSLAQSPFNINCMNWVIGHMLVARDRALKLLNQMPILTDAERERYETESNPVKADEAGVIRLERLLSLLEQQQERVAQGLSDASEALLDEQRQSGQHSTSVAHQLFGLYFHDTYHTGQVDLLRQVAGKNDHIV